MEFSKLEYYISQPRLDRFLTSTRNSKTKAQKLYRINLRVSQAFYPVLNLFEIFLRNVIHNQLSSHFSNTNWIISEQTGFMNDASLAASRFYLKKSVAKAERMILQRGVIVTAGKIIAEQPFGFWTRLFDVPHYRLIGGSVIHCFPNKPSHVGRSTVNRKLNKIRNFRNRIYHNKPICFNGNNIDFSAVIDIKQEIYILLNWIDADLANYVDYFNGIDAKINLANSL